MQSGNPNNQFIINFLLQTINLSINAKQKNTSKMIKEIFLHIGLHKTATTTIQRTLYSEHSKLAKEGILYPKFHIGEEPITNHSIPFYSLFCNNPKEYHINIRKGITTDESIKKLHTDYRDQFEKQITNFHGETLIISGEDISLLSKNELLDFKSYLIKITKPNVNIRVVLMCRHPVSWFRSVLQSRVKTRGITIKKQIDDILLQSHMYRNLIQIISEVFGQDSISVLRYEDIILHTYGPTGAFLEITSENNPGIIKPEKRIENKSSNYETIHLIDAFNTFKTAHYNLKLQRITELIQHLTNMPGQKLMLSKGHSKKVWGWLSEDVNWLCNKYSLQQYQFINEDLNPAIDIWSKQTLNYLKYIYIELPSKYQKIILWEFLQKIFATKEILSITKRFSLLLFVLSTSKSLLISKKN